jgi:hypothetical protein
LKLGGVAIVKVFQGDSNPNFHIWTSSLPRLVAKVTAATEEAGEEVKWVVVVSSTTTLSLLQSFMPILIVDFAGFGVGESFVSFCHFHELLFCGIIASREFALVGE